MSEILTPAELNTLKAEIAAENAEEEELGATTASVEEVVKSLDEEGEDSTQLKTP